MCKLSANKTSSTGTSCHLKAGPIGFPKTEWNYHFMLRTIPEDSKSQNMFNSSSFPTGECQMVEYTGCFMNVDITAGDFLGLFDKKKFI